MKRMRVIAVGLLAVGGWPGAGSAETATPWSARFGYARAGFDTAANVALAGTTVPGAAVTVDDQSFFIGDVGRQLDGHLTVRIAVGLPLDLAVGSGGSLVNYSPPLSGTLGRIEVAPVVATLLYAPANLRGFRPYVGGGASYAWITGTEPGDVAGLAVDDAWGAVLQAGCDYEYDEHWSAFVDVRHVFLDLSATGTLPALGGPPIAAEVSLDPTIVSAGLGYRF